MKTFTAMMICAGLWGVPANAQRPAAALARNPLVLDVAGVRLGMPKAQAEAALASAAYRCEPFGHEATFDERVADEVLRRRGGTAPWGGSGRSGVQQATCTGPNGEALTITWAQLRGGAVVDEFRLVVDPRRIDQEALRAQALTKYGRPTLGTPIDGAWCLDARDCRGGLVLNKGPVFMLRATSGLDVMAGRGQTARDADDAAVVAEAVRRVPAKAGAAF